MNRWRDLSGWEWVAEMRWQMLELYHPCGTERGLKKEEKDKEEGEEEEKEEEVEKMEVERLLEDVEVERRPKDRVGERWM